MEQWSLENNLIESRSQSNRVRRLTCALWRWRRGSVLRIRRSQSSGSSRKVLFPGKLV